jgi:hypothetical protein
MKNLLISGNTLQEWNITDILQNELTREQTLERLAFNDWDNKTGPQCYDYSYYEIEQLERFNDARFR